MNNQVPIRQRMTSTHRAWLDSKTEEEVIRLINGNGVIESTSEGLIEPDERDEVEDETPE